MQLRLRELSSMVEVSGRKKGHKKKKKRKKKKKKKLKQELESSFGGKQGHYAGGCLQQKGQGCL